MKQKEKQEQQEQQEIKRLYEAPRCEWIEVEVEPLLVVSDGGQGGPGSESYRVGR